MTPHDPVHGNEMVRRQPIEDDTRDVSDTAKSEFVPAGRNFCDCDSSTTGLVQSIVQVLQQSGAAQFGPRFKYSQGRPCGFGSTRSMSQPIDNQHVEALFRFASAPAIATFATTRERHSDPTGIEIRSADRTL
jgi:hypothetical protein